jgi:hypothetical protein
LRGSEFLETERQDAVPRDFIVGGGFFLKFSLLPTSLAWDAFGVANGARIFGVSEFYHGQAYQ